MILLIVLEFFLNYLWKTLIFKTVILIRKWNSIRKELISFLSILSSPLHQLSSHFWNFSFTLYFFFFPPIDLHVFELYSIYCVFCAISSHHIDNEITKYMRKSYFHLWLFIIDWSKHSILFLRYFIEFHQTTFSNCYVSSSQILCRHSLPVVFFSSSLPVIRRTRTERTSADRRVSLLSFLHSFDGSPADLLYSSHG